MANNRPIKPVALHVQDGTYRGDRHALPKTCAEPIGEPPADLNSREAAEWNRVRSLLEPLELISATDSTCLYMYVKLFNEFVTLGPEMPASRVAILRGLTGDMYLNPVSMSRTKRNEKQTEINSFSDF